MPGHVPERPMVYHILHVDKLASVLEDGCLWCDAVISSREGSGTQIGMSGIKRRRLEELTLASHPGLFVGQCVPFYFCPRSVMLFMIHKGNHPNLDYRDGEGPIVHLEVDLHDAVEWARNTGQRWALTLSNAGSSYFEDRSDLAGLREIDWTAVGARSWAGPGVSRQVKEKKQAEFLVEGHVPWSRVRRIGVRSEEIGRRVVSLLGGHVHRPPVEVKRDWYYGA